MSSNLQIIIGDHGTADALIEQINNKREGWISQASALLIKTQKIYCEAEQLLKLSQESLIENDESAKIACDKLHIACEKLRNEVQEANTLRFVLQKIAAKLKKPDCKFLIAMSHEGLIEGVSIVELKNQSRNLYIDFLVTAPKNLNVQGNDTPDKDRVKGVGSAIILKTVEFCPNLFCHEITLESAPSARGFYVNKMGFQSKSQLQNDMNLSLPVHCAFNRPDNYIEP
jgi:hypothetical protein